MRGDFDPCSCGHALPGRADAYNEEAFHYCLAIERKRAERSSRPFFLLLVDFENRSELDTVIDYTVAGKLFGALAACLRETDLVGWYREDRIAGAVLTHGGDGQPGDVARQVAKRVTAALRRDVPSSVGGRLQVRVFQLR
jgi:hypothetical protein